VTYVLIPGAGGDAWYWHAVERELRQRGHDTVSVAVPTDDEAAGLTEYTDAVVSAIGDRIDPVLVAQSMGAFLVPLVHQRRQAASIILVNAMIPLPGETPGAWWDNTGQPAARRANDLREGRSPDADFDEATYFFHDVPPELTEYGLGKGPRSRRTSSPGATIGSSRWTSSSGSPASGSASSQMSCQVGIWWR